MADGYTDTPYNMAELIPYIITDNKVIVAEFFAKQQCYFYDTCSFRRHSNLNRTEAEYLLQYIKKQDGMIIITRCILMELASHSGILNQEYVDYIKHIQEFGISVLVLYEEELFLILEIAFHINAAINAYLCWAVRTIKRPVSTITELLSPPR